MCSTRGKVRFSHTLKTSFKIIVSELAFDGSGQPLEAAFYTGFPAYHNLIYQIYQMTQRLETQPSQQREEEEEVKGPPKFWVKRKTLANILAEEISEFQVCLLERS